jgi:hypothetical protein
MKITLLSGLRKRGVRPDKFRENSGFVCNLIIHRGHMKTHILITERESHK